MADKAAAYLLKLCSELFIGTVPKDELLELFQAAQSAVSRKAEYRCDAYGVISLCSLHHCADAFLQNTIRPQPRKVWTGSSRLCPRQTTPAE